MRLLLTIVGMIMLFSTEAQYFYKGGDVVSFNNKEKSYTLSCIIYYKYMHSTQPSFKLKKAKNGKWVWKTDTAYLRKDSYLVDTIGEVQLMISEKNIDYYMENYEQLVSAVLSIDYTGLNMDSKNEMYIDYRDRAIKSLQATRIINLIDRDKEVYIEIPESLVIRYACQTD